MFKINAALTFIQWFYLCLVTTNYNKLGVKVKPRKIKLISFETQKKKKKKKNTVINLENKHCKKHKKH